MLVGGSGFLGHHVVRTLSNAGHQCTVLSRQPNARRELALLQHVSLARADVHDPEALSTHFEGADAVVSMAGILNPFGKNSFARVHVELVEKIVSACQQAGVRRLLHVSALNAGKGSSRYLESKGRGEQVIRGTSDLHSTIFQPSVIFGPGDSFFNRFADLLRWLPVFPLACADAKLQPVYASDVAQAMRDALEDENTHGRSFELGGPSVYTLGELVRYTAGVLGLKRWVIPQPDVLSQLQGLMMGWLPGAPFSLDNYRSLKTDNVCERNGFEYFGIDPSSVEARVPEYLDVSVRQRKLASIRRRARR